MPFGEKVQDDEARKYDAQGVFHLAQEGAGVAPRRPLATSCMHVYSVIMHMCIQTWVVRDATHCFMM